MTYRSDFLVRPPARAPFTGPAPRFGESWIYYHLAADGAVLYIGMTSQPRDRTRQHESGSAWYGDVAQIVWFGPMDEVNATAVERELIGVEQPPHNIRHTERDTPRPVGPRVRLSRARRRVATLRSELETAERVLAQCERAVVRDAQAVSA